jgi:hypothetical protein
MEGVDQWPTVIAGLIADNFVAENACPLANMAERVGFEPTVRFPAHTLSKRAP